MNDIKVLTILGTRPEIIKLSEVMKELDKHTNHIIVHTGQNYDYELSEIFFNDLEIFNLSIKSKLFSETAIALLDLTLLLKLLVIRSIAQLSFERLIAVTNPVKLPPIMQIFCLFMIFFYKLILTIINK